MQGDEYIDFGVDKNMHQLYTTSMIRTQIYIPETLHERAKLIAKNKKQSLANVYRSFITQGLESTQQKQAQKGLDFLINLKLKGGPKDLSTNIDHYLYGGPKKKTK